MGLRGSMQISVIFELPGGILVSLPITKAAMIGRQMSGDLAVTRGWLVSITKMHPSDIF